MIKPGNHNFIRSFGAEGIRVVDRLYRGSLVLSAGALHDDWSVESLSELTVENLEPVFELNPEVVLLGTGARQEFPAPEIMMAFYSRGIGLESMTTEAACRTFNVLVSEDRNVVAALIGIR